MKTSEPAEQIGRDIRTEFLNILRFNNRSCEKKHLDIEAADCTNKNDEDAFNKNSRMK